MAFGEGELSPLRSMRSRSYAVQMRQVMQHPSANDSRARTRARGTGGATREARLVGRPEPGGAVGLSAAGPVLPAEGKGLSRTLMAALIAVSVCAGCAKYTAMSAPVPAAAAMPAWQDEGAVAAGADAYVQPERQQAIFGAALGDAGVLAIQVFVQNHGAHSVQVRRADLELGLPDGRKLSPSVAAAVVAAALAPPRETTKSGTLTRIGRSLVPAGSGEQASSARLGDYKSKEFQDVTLGPSETAHGFVYFIPPEGTPAFDAAPLTVPFVDIEKVSSTVIALPLTGLAYKGTPEGPAPGRATKKTR